MIDSHGYGGGSTTQLHPLLLINHYPSVCSLLLSWLNYGRRCSRRPRHHSPSIFSLSFRRLPTAPAETVDGNRIRRRLIVASGVRGMTIGGRRVISVR